MIRIPKKFLPLIIAVILGLVATFLINSYVQQQTETAKKRLISQQQNITTVIVARQDIAAGTPLTENMLKEVNVYKDSIQPRAAASMDRVVNMITLVPVSKGEQILLNKISMGGQGESISLSSKVPVGKRAITIAVDNIASVGGMIKPGDHVDVVGMVPMPAMDAAGRQGVQNTNLPLFQDVLVLAVGQEFTSVPIQKKEERTVSPVITLALAPEEANLIAFVQEQGKVRLILRSPEDTQKQAVPPASWDTLLRTVMPQAYQAQPVKQEAPKPKKTVEIYRGLNKEVKNLE
jgi:pilus assembly protein CpaB